eukprot:201362_1
MELGSSSCFCFSVMAILSLNTCKHWRFNHAAMLGLHLNSLTLICEMKPISRILTGISRHLYQSTLHLHQCRSILQHASSISTTNTMDDAPPVRLSTQYPPPPLEERYSKTKPTSGAKIEPYKDVQFKSKDAKSEVRTAGGIPVDIHDNNKVDRQAPVPSTPEEELSLGGAHIDPLELKKMIPHGTATKEEIENAINEENIEWKGVHWSERHYTAKLGDIVNRQRPKEITRLMESSKPAIHRDGMRSIKPVEAGGPAYPIFYDAKTGDGLQRPQANLPKDIDGRKSRVTHIISLQKATKLGHSECALEYDYAKGQYSIALERLRNRQVDRLVQTTHKPKEQCKKVFDQCLGDVEKALRKLNR